MMGILSSLKKSNWKFSVLFVFLCLTISTSLLLLSRLAEGFAQGYAVQFYPWFQMLLGRAFSFWDHSFFEAGILLFLLLIVSVFLSGIFFLIKRSDAAKRNMSFLLRGTACVLSGLILVYTLTAAVNYHRDSIGIVLNLPAAESSGESLARLSMILAEDMRALTDDPEWNYGILTEFDDAYIENRAVYAMKQIGQGEPSLSGYYSKPKPIYFSNLLSDLGIDGIFSPFTMEANYNNKITPFLIPYTICHELAHSKGYMKEEDAGFIAYLACRSSSSRLFEYSGLFHGLVFAMDALRAEAGEAAFDAVYQKLPEPVQIQLRYVMEQSRQQASSFASAAISVNDLYLKVNAQSGMNSYGRVVELLMADYADRIHGEDLL